MNSLMCLMSSCSFWYFFICTTCRTDGGKRGKQMWALAGGSSTPPSQKVEEGPSAQPVLWRAAVLPPFQARKR